MKRLIVVFLAILMFSLTGCNKEYEFVLYEGQDIVEINTAWEDAGAALDMKTYWKEAYIIEGEVDVTTLGIYEIKYSVTYREDTYHITRYVQVTDQTPPVIILNSGLDTLTLGSTWEDMGAIVTDNSGEEIVLSVNGEVNTSIAGTYEITYSATDSSGNETVLIRYVDILE